MGAVCGGAARPPFQPSAFSTTVSVVLFAALAECQATESCGGKDDCRECVDLTANRTQCVSREFCEWGKELQIPITPADIVFVVATNRVRTVHNMALYQACGGLRVLGGGGWFRRV